MSRAGGSRPVNAKQPPKSTLDQAHVISLPRKSDARGSLSFVEAQRHIPFQIKRVYYLYGVPAGESRGGHAHRELDQLMIAAAGSFDVVLGDGRNQRRFSLDSPDRGLVVPRMAWREMENFSAGAVCLVLASEYYDEGDYYRDYEEFLRAVGAR
ncbi:MAG TPA: FdtA/QdtA family cupin domain-containing protein [Gemmatimonadaceae bacterium]